MQFAFNGNLEGSTNQNVSTGGAYSFVSSSAIRLTGSGAYCSPQSTCGWLTSPPIFDQSMPRGATMTVWFRWVSSGYLHNEDIISFIDRGDGGTTGYDDGHGSVTVLHSEYNRNGMSRHTGYTSAMPGFVLLAFVVTGDTCGMNTYQMFWVDSSGVSTAPGGTNMTFGNNMNLCTMPYIQFNRHCWTYGCSSRETIELDDLRVYDAPVDINGLAEIYAAGPD